MVKMSLDEAKRIVNNPSKYMYHDPDGKYDKAVKK
jgi:hypothetical protein